MAEILTFTGFRKCESAKDAFDEDLFRADLYATEPQEALSGLATASVGSPTGCKGALEVSFGALPADSNSDWTNQELADLYRVEALLVQANIRIETTRGISDEGDPWMVFCHTDGEVFVHLARIAGLYVLDGPGLDTVLSGPSFSALIDRFANAVATRTPKGNIVQFRNGSTNSVVRLHPAVMLAALVWSLYLASDHLVGSAQAAELDTDSHAPLLPPLAVDPGPGQTVHEIADEALVQLDDGGADKMPPGDFQRPFIRETDISRTTAPADGSSSYWATLSNSTGIAAGLTAIAISFGLYDSDEIGRTGDHTRLPYTEAPSITEDSLHTAPVPLGFTIAETETAEGRYTTTTREITPEAEPANVLHPINEQVSVMNAHLGAEVKVEVAVQDETTNKASLPHPIEEVALIGQAEVSLSQGASLISLTSTDDMRDLQSLVGLATQHLGQAHVYELAGLSVDATFDVSTLSQQTAQLVLSDLTRQTERADAAPIDEVDSQVGVLDADMIAQYLPYDNAAKDFVYQFLLRAPSSIEMIKSDSKVVFIDMSAADHAYSVSWIMDDHTIVSTIGHAQDFADLPLV